MDSDPDSLLDQLEQLKQPKVYYVQNMTVLDIDPDKPPTFANWDEADQFLIHQQQSETVSRWLTGMAAKHLPREDEGHSFARWCLRARISPNRVAVWRRMAELYDFRGEVQRFPELSHKHFEVMMGRMSKAKRRAAETGDTSLYDQVIAQLKEANDSGQSCEKMLACVLESEGKHADMADLALKVQGQLAFLKLRLPGIETPISCAILIPESNAQADVWQKMADARDVTNQVVAAVITRADTE